MSDPDPMMALKNQVVMQTLCNTNNLTLSGDEDGVARQKWANLMKFKLKYWDLEAMPPEFLFSSTLSGKAWAQYQTIKQEDGEDNPTFADRVVSHFSKVPEIRSEEVSDFITDLKTRRLNPGESYEEAYARLKAEISRLPWGDKARDDLLRCTYAQLLPPIPREVLKLHEDSSADDYFKLSRRYVVSREASGQSSNWPHMAQLEQPPIKEVRLASQEAKPSSSTALLDLEKRVFDRMDSQQASFEKSMASVMKSFQTSLAELAKDPSQQQDSKDSKKKNRVNNVGQQNGGRLPCQICGGTNHFAKTCRERYTPSQQAQKTAAPSTVALLKCQLCNKEGHEANDCILKPSIRCNGCNKWGHYRSECPTNPPPYRRQYSRGRGSFYPSNYGRGGFYQPLQYVPYAQPGASAQAQYQQPGASAQAPYQQPPPPGTYLALPAPANSGSLNR